MIEGTENPATEPGKHGVNPRIEIRNVGSESGRQNTRQGIRYRTKSLLKRYRFAIAFASLIVVMYIANKPLGTEAFEVSVSTTREMLSLLPPVFILMGLLDAWVPKETIVKYMGENSGLKGVFAALFLGSAAAGPLYVAFPITALLLRKRARLAYILFFLGAWSTTKLPLLLYEITYMGLRFTAIQVGVCIPFFLLFSYIIERIIPKEAREALYRKAEIETP